MCFAVLVDEKRSILPNIVTMPKKVPKKAFPDYEHPPVVERVATIRAPIAEESYVSRMDAWQELVEPEFPVFEPLAEWKVSVQQSGNQAVVDPTQGQVVVVPRFSKRASTEGFDWSIRCPKDGFVMNMHSSPSEPRHYSDLTEQCSKWLPRWMTHFGVRRCTQVELYYVNILNLQSVEAFIKPGNVIEAARILTIFVHVPGTHKTIIPPINCMVNVALEAERAATMKIQLVDGPAPSPSLRLDLAAQIALRPNAQVDEMLHWLDWCHDRILERFDVVFTAEAKKSFKPILR